MAYNEPLDQFNTPDNILTAQEIMRRLQKHGFNEVYEVADGSIEIKGQPSLKCQITKSADNSWVPDVSVEWMSAYALIPSLAFILLGQTAGFNGVLPTAISAALGVGVGGLLLDSKKKALIQRLEVAVFEVE